MTGHPFSAEEISEATAQLLIHLAQSSHSQFCKPLEEAVKGNLNVLEVPYKILKQ